MFRLLTAGLLAAGIAFAAVMPETTAQEKAQPKKKERIAIAEPKDAAKDPDFAIQGEYEGEFNPNAYGNYAKRDRIVKLGVQVIATGLGEFHLKYFEGGLPGAGWKGAQGWEHAAVSNNGKVEVLNSKKEVIGTLTGGKITVKSEKLSAKRIDRKSKTLGAKPPQGAVVLFGEPGDEKNWSNGKLMELSDGKFLTVFKAGSVKSKAKFGAFKAHIEFRLPWMPNSTGQGRGNSGVYIQDRYECQVLDSFGLKGENNECGGIYTQHKPLVNMCLPPMVWQTYDMEFTPAVFEGEKKVKNARTTIYHNGVKIHDDIEFPKECPGGQKEAELPGPFQFQDHGDPVVYRNVWVVPVK
jgi:Domain of Unknown Function (DUF1080)